MKQRSKGYWLGLGIFFTGFGLVMVAVISNAQSTFGSYFSIPAWIWVVIIFELIYGIYCISKGVTWKYDPRPAEIERLNSAIYPQLTPKSQAELKTVGQVFEGLPELVARLDSVKAAGLKFVDNLNFQIVITTTHLIIFAPNTLKLMKFSKFDGVGFSAIPIPQVDRIEISGQHHTQYAGYTSNDSNYLVLTVFAKDGQQYSRALEIGSTEAIMNALRPFYVEKLKHLSDWVPVVATGHQIESSDGYITSTSIGFWQGF